MLAGAITVGQACAVLSDLRSGGDHRFVGNDVSPTDEDSPQVAGHRQVTDALLLTVARRAGFKLVTFDRALAELAGDDAKLLER